MKHFYCLSLMALVLWSCSKSPDLEVTSEKPTVPTTFATKAISGTSVENYAIYIYGSDTTLLAKVSGLTSEEPVPVNLPYLEDLKAIVVANGESSTTQTDSLTTLRISLGSQCENEIFVSDIVSFKTDAADKSIELNLKRIVGKVSFIPTETEAEINAVSQFDAIAVSFTNPITAFYPGAKADVQYETTPVVTVNTDKSKGFAASIFSYPNANVKIALEYSLNKTVVNATKEDIPENGIDVKTSVNGQVAMSLYESYFLTDEFTKSFGKPAVTVNYLEF